ncbi:hypothetical protein RI367_007958 [Sorochytrium milnesiophthora]
MTTFRKLMLAITVCSVVLLPLSASAVHAQDNQYLVTLRSGVDFDSTVSTISNMMENDNARRPLNRVASASVSAGSGGSLIRNTIRHQYDGDLVNAVAVQATPDMVKSLQKRPEVAAVAPDGRVRIADVETISPNWGLTRISERALDLVNDTGYTYPTQAGQGVTVWVIDTGIDDQHPDFGGRALKGRTFCANCTNNDDNGHGTAVAGIIASYTFGVAKSAVVVGVKTLNANGQGSWSDVLAALNWVYRQASQMTNAQHVINLSLVGDVNWVVNLFIDQLSSKGITVVVAAGNDAKNACDSSPASASTAIAVGSVDPTDSVSYFSNFGSCVAVFAPGEQIHTTTNDGGDDDQFTGTSFAAPHVAGVAALYYSVYPWLTPAAMRQALVDNSSRNRIVLSTLPPNSPNLIVYNDPNGGPDSASRSSFNSANINKPASSTSASAASATTSATTSSTTIAATTTSSTQSTDTAAAQASATTSVTTTTGSGTTATGTTASTPTFT